MKFSCKSERTLGILWQFQIFFKSFHTFWILKKTLPLLFKIFNLSAMGYSGIVSKYSPLLVKCLRSVCSLNRRSGCQAALRETWKMEFWISLWFTQKHNQNEAHNPNISSLAPSQAEIPMGCTPKVAKINPPYQDSTNRDFDKNQNLGFIWSIFWDYIIIWIVQAI